MKHLTFFAIMLVLLVANPPTAFGQRTTQSDNWNNWVAVRGTPLGDGVGGNSRSVIWGGPAGRQRFIAVGNSTRIPFAYSSDGVNWNAPVDRSSPIVMTGIGGMIIWGSPSGRGRFVRVESYTDVPYNNVYLYTSTDGESWSTHGGWEFLLWEGGRNIRHLEWGGSAGWERFVGVGERMIMYSADGENWRAIYADLKFGGLAWGGTVGQERFITGAIPLEPEQYYADYMEREATRYKAVGGITMVYSDDGENWNFFSEEMEPVRAFGNATAINAIAWGGPSGQKRFVVGLNNGVIAYSADGSNWTAVSNSTFDGNSINAIAWGGPSGRERFVAVGNNGKIAHSVDGVRWTAVPNSTFGSTHINCIAAGRQRFVAVGNEGKMAYLAFD
ncbi:MAG: hypothetical protein LBI28_12505 [Treponema sp.]|jgi:hypothetical protein|nr:hypothetical protein [Treponema sp.]